LTKSTSKAKKSILFLTPSPLGISPGQRFRVEHYLPILEQEGFTYKVRPFLSLRGRKQLYTKGNVLGKVFAIMGGFWRRLGDMFILYKYDYIYIHRWATTAGPPVFEWFIAKVFRKKIIYDFDDAIWVNESAYNKKYLAVKFLGKVAKICKWSYKVSVGNAYLYKFAAKHNKDTIIIPTVVNTDEVHNRLQNHDTDTPAVGWTGSFSTLLYLDMIVPVLQRLQEKLSFTFFVIADKDPKLPLKNYKFIQWNSKTEVDDLLNFHIGLMPLTDDEITRGKCGFKAIQYMSLGMATVVSPVGVNNEIVDNRVSGFICNSEKEWEEKILLLLTDKNLRKKTGCAAREKIDRYFSVKSTANSFISLFE
jgi:glycosyltransferase involved in cell wall biosynthesis